MSGILFFIFTSCHPLINRFFPYFSGDYEGYSETFMNLGGKRINLVPIVDNLVDQIWDTQPAYPNTTLLILDAMKYTGKRFYRLATLSLPIEQDN